MGSEGAPANRGLVHLSRPASHYAGAVEAAAAWLTPRRLRVYPAALSLGVILSAAWMSFAAVRSGVPFFLTVGQDFKGYYTGGRFFVEGRLAELYNFEAQQAFQKSLAIPEDKLLPFIHPPFTVILWAPFALRNYALGLLLWWAAGLLALVVSLRLLRRELMPASNVSLRRLVLLAFLFYPALAWFLYAQNTALTLLLYTLTFVLLRRGRDFAAGLALGLLLYKPQLALVLCGVLVIKWRWRALLGVALCAGLWLALGFALSPAAMREYATISPKLLSLLVSASSPDSKVWAVHTFYSFAVLLLGGLWPRGAEILGALLTSGGLILVATWWWSAPWQPGTRAWDMVFAATLTLGLLITPYVYFYDLMLLLVPLAIVWSYYPGGQEGRALDGGPLLAWTAALYVVTFAGNFLSAAAWPLSASFGLPRIALQVSVPVIAAWAWLVRRLAQAPTAAPSPSEQCR